MSLRLTVVIDAPKGAIKQVIGNHALVRQLLANGWLHQRRYDGDRFLRYATGRWQELDMETGCRVTKDKQLRY
ncbi:MAG: hypothetical protein Q8R72_02180 [Hylemonella sp.]|nr:hypothetical protein [Hylemonella sp.]